jgi:hypothetical protein
VATAAGAHDQQLVLYYPSVFMSLLVVPRLDPRLLARHPTRDRRPEPLPMLTPADRRAPRRTHHRPARQL